MDVGRQLGIMQPISGSGGEGEIPSLDHKDRHIIATTHRLGTARHWLILVPHRYTNYMFVPDSFSCCIGIQKQLWPARHQRHLVAATYTPPRGQLRRVVRGQALSFRAFSLDGSRQLGTTQPISGSGVEGEIPSLDHSNRQVIAAPHRLGAARPALVTSATLSTTWKRAPVRYGKQAQSLRDGSSNDAHAHRHDAATWFADRL